MVGPMSANDVPVWADARAETGADRSGSGRAARRIRYQVIAEELRGEVANLAGGSVLASEAELSARFEASRVTVRRALEVLRDDGVIDSRQGFGWFVVGEPVRQYLGQLGTIESQLESSGKIAAHRIEEFGFHSPPEEVAEVFGSRADVLRVKRVNLADGQPFAVVTVWCAEPYGAQLSREDVERAPFTEVLDVDLAGVSQTIGADSAETDDAHRLGVPVGSPVLRCRRVTTDRAGAAILFSEHIFAAHRTEFVVELTSASSTPSGLRLIR
jgi:GntR family transcriptional regulator